MNYYIDPKTEDIIIYDPEENEIRVAKFIGEETEYEEDGEEPEKPRKESLKTGKPKDGKEKFCHSCKQLKPVSEFRSKGYTKKGTKTFAKKCKECEGIRRTKPHKIDDKTIGRIRSMRREGFSKKDIAAELEISYMTVHKYLKDGYEDLKTTKPDYPPGSTKEEKKGFKPFPTEQEPEESEQSEDENEDI